MSFLLAFILISFGSGFRWDSRSVKALRESDCPCSAFSGVFHFGVMWGQCNWNYAKNTVANRKGQPVALVPQPWQLQTHKRERHKEGTVDQSNQKVLLKYSFLNQDVFLWNWAWSLSHLKLKHLILKQTMSQLKCWKQFFFFSYFVLFPWMALKKSSDKSKTVLISPSLFNTFIRVPNGLITTCQLQNSSPVFTRKLWSTYDWSQN